MRPAATLLILSALVFSGCGTARRVAVTSFRVIDAPASYVRNRIDSTETTTTRTTTYTEGATDVVSPGYPVPPSGPVASTTRPSPQTRPSTGAGATPRPPRTTATTAGTQPRPSPAATAPRPIGTQTFPTAKPVPGKPGYVYSIDPKGGLVDVTGYKSGDKAKDPYTQQIFVVP